MDYFDLAVNLFYFLVRRSFGFYISYAAACFLFLFDIPGFVFVLDICFDRLLRIVNLFRKDVSFRFVRLVILFGLREFRCLFLLFLVICETVLA